MPSASSAPTLPFLERLLDGEKVEWKTLGDKEYISIEDNARKAVNSRSRIPGKTPYYGANNIQDYVEGYTHDGVYILIAEDGTASIEQYSIQWAEGKFWANNHVHVIRGTEKINNRFLYYFLKTVNFTPFLMGGGRAKLTKAKLQEIPFAIPPLRVQSRIVEILDKFTQLEAELEDELAKELEARKKQYDFYRNRLLDFALRDDLKGQVEWKTLGEVAEYVRQRVAVDQLCAQTYVGVDNLLPNRAGKQDSNYLPTEGNAIAYQPNDILIGNIRPYLKKIWKADNEGGASADVLVVRITNSLLTPGYLYHLLADDRFFSYDMQHAKGAKMPRGNKEKILDYVLPLPPLSEQRRIVDILDRFDTLTNSISEGLPREIALRRKQYEYYRDALLRFPQPTPTA